ncbi:MAG TPA: protein kinase [Polyangiaceae bacterium]|jgi:serine/threonine-protein kinase|nr:protein kinase [Polyangiaceae bacterium]
MIGRKLDRFELIAELASGGMGTVYLARLGGAGGFQRLYAIKRLHEHLARHTEFIEMFLDEARLAARIHHPNVVPILEIGTTDAGHYLVMEYVEGDTAGHLFFAAAQEQKKVPPRVAVRIVLDALAGLHAAHEGTDDEGNLLELVHRDVSPHNILVSVDGVSRLTDFGIARAASRLAVTRAGQLKGKIAYMAPEQARSEKIDRRADVFAMGICLWEMLVGQRLFKADAEGDTLNRLLYEPIPTADEANPEVPRALAEVCAKALVRDLGKRYPTAAAFADDLEATARSIDALATHREVAACVGEVLGADLSERRADLRAFLADADRPGDLPPGEDLPAPAIERVRGAHVTAEVPSLFESGSLRAHTGLDSQSPARRKSRVGRVIALLVVVLVFVGVRHFRHSKDAAGTAAESVPPKAVEGVPTAPQTEAPSEAAHVDPALPAPRPEATVATASPEATLSTAVPIPPASAQAVPPQRASFVAVTKTAHATPPPPDAPRPAPSVPRDMLYNPYR